MWQYAADVRPSVKEQVESLGARFVDVENDENFEDNGGYAGETSAAYQKRQQKAVAEQLAKTDLAVTTALIPGKPAPRLISAEMLRNMPEGSVVVDIRIGGVTVIGDSNLAAGVPASASTLFARNVFNFLNAMYNPETKNITFDFADELVAKTCICKDGQLTGALK